MPFLESSSNRLGNGAVVLVPRNFFFARAVERHEMIARNVALLRVELGELDRVRRVLIKKNYRRVRQ